MSLGSLSLGRVSNAGVTKPAGDTQPQIENQLTQPFTPVSHHARAAFHSPNTRLPRFSRPAVTKTLGAQGSAQPVLLPRDLTNNSPTEGGHHPFCRYRVGSHRSFSIPQDPVIHALGP
jgi:hypothetical protein